MGGLERHVKTEHEQQGIEKRVPTSIKRKRKIIELQSRHNDQLSDDSDDLQDLPLLLDRDNIPKLKTTTATTTTKSKKENNSIKDQYKLAKAQLNYILRENEMLCDEWSTTEKKLKRLRTERRVLLDALVRRGYNNEDE
jgi:hypothetical protein